MPHQSGIRSPTSRKPYRRRSSRPGYAARTPGSNPPNAALCRFSALAELSDTERDFLRQQMVRLQSMGPETTLIEMNALLTRPFYLVSGWAARVWALPDSRRQILDFFLPGDLIGYSSRAQARALAPYISLTSVEIASAGELYRRVQEDDESLPGLIAACRRFEHEQEVRMLTQIMRMGRRTAYERMADLFLEFYSRLSAAGVATALTSAMPLKQEILGEALGISIVHVNRTLQQLRREGLIRTKKRQITLLEPEILAAIADHKEA
jgi:CRP-like cAMP-binding protein